MSLKYLLILTLIAGNIFPADKKYDEVAKSMVCFFEYEYTETVQLGDSFQVEAFASCPLEEITSVVWEPTDYLTCDSQLCLNPTIKPLKDTCYDITVTWEDGSISMTNFCVNILSCDRPTENKIIEISPQLIEDETTITFELIRKQYCYFEIVEDNEVIHSLWEGWVSAGVNELDLNFENIPSGNYELRGNFYPENKSVQITKL